MIDLKLLRNDFENTYSRLATKYSCDTDKGNLYTMLEDVVRLDRWLRWDKENLDCMRQVLKMLQKEYGLAVQQKDEVRLARVKKDIVWFKDEEKHFEHKLRETEAELNPLLLEIPNLPHESVPVSTQKCNCGWCSLKREAGFIP